MKQCSISNDCELIEFPDDVKFQEKYDPAMKIHDQIEADIYFESCVQHTMRCLNRSRNEAESLERLNIAYWVGFYDDVTQMRIRGLFQL